MLAQFGFGVLLVTFLVALFSMGAAIYGYYSKLDHWMESSRRALQLTFPLISLSALTLIYLLVAGHFELEYVYSVTSREMPAYLKVTALWGGQAGSLVLWSWLMSAFATAVTLSNWERDRDFLPWVVVVIAATLAFFLSLSIFFENPFARLWQTISGEVASQMFAPIGTVLFTPADGQGLNELLRHPGMVFHPPMLYLGFVGFVIPYAFAVAALVTGRTDDRWIRLTRRWTLVAWLFLSLGLVLGMRWAYDVLGWGGYWSWDPVEIAALMPWLVGTAFLHSVMIQEKRGMFKQWNMLLIILTYSLVIFGTFLTRSGVLSSVHAFAQSAIGPMFFIFIGITFIISASLLIYRWSDLRAEVEMKSILSREALFLLNNLLFFGVLIVCFWGVIFPLISEIVTGQQLTVGPPFYLWATGPLWGALIALMGIAPLSAWGRSTVRTLGKAMWKPAIPTLLTPAILFIFGMRNWIALTGFTLVSFVIFTILFEFWRTRVNNIFKKLGRTTWLLLIPTFIALVVYTILGIHNWLVLVWYTLVAYLGFVILTQIWRYWIQSVSKTFWRSVWLLLIALIVLLENLIVPMIFAILGLQYFALVFYIQVPNFLVILWILSRNNPRRYGGYLIHLSMVVMAIGILGIDVFQTQTQQTLAIGQQVQISGYTLRYDSLAQFPYVDGRQVTRAVLSVFKDGKLLGELHPRYDLYPDGQPMTIPAIRSTMVDDLYVVLVNWENVSAEQTPFKVYHNPLVNWLWVGSFIFIFGILVAGWPIRNQVWSKK